MENQFWYFNIGEHQPTRFIIGSETEADRLNSVFKEMGFQNESKDEDRFNGRTIKVLFTDVSSIRKLSASSAIPLQNQTGELVYRKLGHSVYVYRDFAAVIYSSQAKEWKCYLNGNPQLWNNIEMNILFKMVVGRILSLIFEKTSIVGFFGVPVEEGVVVMNAKEAKGEFVFFDVQNKKIITQDGVKSFDFPNKILRLETTHSNYEKKMRPEELYSFLMARTALLSLGVNNLYQVNAIKKLTKLSEGVIFPEKSFKPRVSVGA